MSLLLCLTDWWGCDPVQHLWSSHSKSIFFILDQLAAVSWSDPQGSGQVISTVIYYCTLPLSLVLGMNGKEVVESFKAKS